MEKETKEIYRLISSYRREIFSELEIRVDSSLIATLEELEKQAAMRERRLIAALNTRQLRLVGAFAVGAVITTGLLVSQHFENQKLQRLIVSMTDNNVLITPNGKDFYSINNFLLENGCSQYAVQRKDLWEKNPWKERPVLTFRLPEQEGCKP
jgi:hypothetical protein